MNIHTYLGNAGRFSRLPMIGLCLLFFFGHKIFCADSHAAIIYAQPPLECDLAAESTLQSHYQMFSSMIPPGININDLKIRDAHHWYFFDQPNIDSGKILGGTNALGWLYFVTARTNLFFEMGMYQDKDNKWRLGTGLGRVGSKEPHPFELALHLAESLPQTRNADYELRILFSPLSFWAMWLHGSTNDIIIPLPPTYNGMKAYVPYSEEQIVSFLKKR